MHNNARKILANSGSKITAGLLFRKNRPNEPRQVAARATNQQNYKKHEKNDFYRKSKNSIFKNNF